MTHHHLILHDAHLGADLRPLTWLRPVADLTLGATSLAATWQRALTHSRPQQNPAPTIAFRTECLAQALFPAPAEPQGTALHILGGLVPTPEAVRQVATLTEGQALLDGGELLAFVGDAMEAWGRGSKRSVAWSGDAPLILRRPWDLFRYAKAGSEIAWALREGPAQPLDPSVQVLGDPALIHLAPGAKAEACTLNTRSGPIYIAPDAEIQEGCLVRGPVVLGDHSIFKMGAKIYGPTIVGRHCKVAGEVSECVIQDYSNKGHDGYLGDSVLGSWCNLGAGTNSSNLKNTYDTVRAYAEATGRFEETGLQFCGLIMGDHSKSAIGTLFNTGTVVGPFCNIYGAGFPRVYIPGFSWGGAQGIQVHALPRALETAERVMARRNCLLTPALRQAIEALFEHLTTHAGE